MRLKYFLRGLGIGIAVTTIILAISHSANRRMSDSEVVERARELGMTYTTAAQESTSDNGASQESTKESENSTEEFIKESDETPSDDISSDEASSNDISSREPSSSENASETETSTEEEASSVQETSSEQETTSVRETTSAQPVTETTTPQETTTQEPQTETENVTEPETGTVVTYTLTIASGMSSNTVCEMLKRAGIIENSVDFDNFLVGSGYADRIRVGSFEVNSGMSYEELAATFCSR